MVAVVAVSEVVLECNCTYGLREMHAVVPSIVGFASPRFEHPGRGTHTRRVDHAQAIRMRRGTHLTMRLSIHAYYIITLLFVCCYNSLASVLARQISSKNPAGVPHHDSALVFSQLKSRTTSKPYGRRSYSLRRTPVGDGRMVVVCIGASLKMSVIRLTRGV